MTWCERPDDGGRVCVHRFVPRVAAVSAAEEAEASPAEAPTATLLEELEKLAINERTSALHQATPADADALATLAVPWLPRLHAHLTRPD